MVTGKATFLGTSYTLPQFFRSLPSSTDLAHRN